MRYFRCAATNVSGKKRVGDFDAVAQLIPSMDGVTPGLAEFQIDPHRHVQLHHIATKAGHQFGLFA